MLIAPTLAEMRETNTAPSRNATALVANGIAIPMANRNAPIGGPTSWLSVMYAPCIRALPIAEVLTRHDAWHEGAAGGVGEDLRGAQHKDRREDGRDADGARDDRRREQHQHDGAHDVGTDYQRRRLNRSAATPPMRPNSSHGRYRR